MDLPRKYVDDKKLLDLKLVCTVLKILQRKFETFNYSWIILSTNEERPFEELTEQLYMFERNFIKGEKG